MSPFLMVLYVLANVAIVSFLTVLPGYCSQQRFIHLVKLHLAISWDVEDYYQKSSSPHSTKENVFKLTTQSCNAFTLI